MNRTLTYPMRRALEIAAGTEVEPIVRKAAAAGQDAMAFMLTDNGDGTYDITAQEPSGVMVAWFLPDYTASQAAIPGGEPADDLHVTLAYLGDAAGLSLADQRKLIGVVGEVCLDQKCLEGTLEGTGRFSNGEATDPFWVGVNIPGITDLRNKLVTALSDAGFQLQGHTAGDGEYVPHVTVDYIPAGAEVPPVTFQPVDAWLDKLTVAVGPHRFTLDLQDDDTETIIDNRGWTPQAINKAIDTSTEDRYTLAPWYIPDRLDAHGEWSDKHELQKSFWGYLEKPDRDIRLQHDTRIVAGRWKDGVVWPTEFTTTLQKADGSTSEHTFPAGTPFLGVQWEPWAWQLVKKGLIRGYSIGGTSERMMVDLPQAEVAKATEHAEKVPGSDQEHPAPAKRRRKPGLGIIPDPSTDTGTA